MNFKNLFKAMLPEIIVLILVGGSLYLAVIDPDCRAGFIKLATVSVEAYFRRSLPKSKDD